MRLRAWTVALAVLAVSPVLAATESPWNDKMERGSDPLVVVNGESITLQELHESLMRRYAFQTLSELVQRRLIEQEARKAGVVLGADEIEKRYREVRDKVIKDARREAEARKEDPEKVNGDRVFDLWVYNNYWTPEDFRRHLHTNLLSEKIVRKSVSVKDADLTTLQARVLTFSHEKHTPEEALKLAEDAQRKLAGGADFAALAKQLSEEPSAADGGRLPEFQAGGIYLPVEPDAAAALLKIKPGQITAAIRGRYGSYVLKLESKETAAEMDLLTREQVRQGLIGERVRAALAPWLRDLKKRAQVEVKDQRLQGSADQ